jgi:hypothetical protein
MPQFSNTGPVWVVELSHREAEAVQGSVGLIGGLVTALLGGPVAGLVVAAIAAAAGDIQLMDAIGGDNGVEVTGVIGVRGVIVTPHASGMFGTLVQAARVTVAGDTIVEFLLKSGGQIPALASALGISVAASVFSAITTGIPLGWAIAGAFGAIFKLFESAPDPNAHGGIHADRDAVGDWERFIMVNLGSSDHIALLSWQGLFSAQGGGGGDVYANRPQVKQWETWTLIVNQDRTISFRTFNGHFLTAINGGGSYCLADRTAIGNWERFYLENRPGGFIAIKTHDKGKYLSVQPGK